MEQISFITIRQAQRQWAATPPAARLKVMARARRIVADRAAEFADSVVLPGRRESAETLPLEVIPLLDALRFLCRNGRQVLRPKRYGMAGRPFWLCGVSARVERIPFGIVFVVGAFNYPLFLPGTQALQALAGGNAVVVKPSPDHDAPMRLLGECLKQAGLPDNLFAIAGTGIPAVEQAFAAGVDKVVLTGSAQAGSAVMHLAADHCVPAIMELSGNDAVLVHEDCDIGLAVRALAYGLRLNGGATCIAPRRVFVAAEIFDELAGQMKGLVSRMQPVPVSAAALVQVSRLLDEARSADSIVHGGVFASKMMSPAIVIDPPVESGLLNADIFAPVMSLMPVRDMRQAIEAVVHSRYCLSVSIFAPPGVARKLAAEVDVGTVVINDLIVPTADPRLPFEASGASGFGATRGAEGLLAMTRSATRIARRGKSRPHLDASISTGDAAFFLAYAEAVHGGMTGAMPGRLIRLVREAVRMRNRRSRIAPP